MIDHTGIPICGDRLDEATFLDHANCMARLTIRLDFDSGASIGPGKIRLLETVEETGSIRKAAEALGMSFRQAWLLLGAIEDMFGEPVIVTSRGGAGGGGSALTELGRLAVSRYRSLERCASEAAQDDMARLEAKVRKGRAATLPRKSRITRKPLKNKR